MICPKPIVSGHLSINYGNGGLFIIFLGLIKGFLMYAWAWKDFVDLGSMALSSEKDAMSRTMN